MMLMILVLSFKIAAVYQKKVSEVFIPEDNHSNSSFMAYNH
jgi:hypothetical protein